jgi:hypothetical protein
MAESYYYFGCTVWFDCPICSRCSAERMVYQARSPDPERIAAALSKQALDCQICGAALTSGSRLKIHVLPASLERLSDLGFAIRRAA